MSNLNNREIIGLYNTMPYYAKNKDKIDKVLIPINVKEKGLVQATVNGLVSQYDRELPYNTVTHKTNLTTIKTMVPHTDNNLVLNVRDKYGENAARYSFGYKPNLPSTEARHKYYMFSDIVPTIRDPKMADYIYVDSSCYEKYLVTEELQNLATSGYEALLVIPLVLKHWDHLLNFISDSEELKKNILLDLKKSGCKEYYKSLNVLKSSFYSIPAIDIEELTRDECFYVLLAYFLEDYYNTYNGSLNRGEIGRLLYRIVGGADLSNLNVQFPPIVNFEQELKTNKCPKEASFVNLVRPPLPPKPCGNFLKPVIAPKPKTPNVCIKKQAPMPPVKPTNCVNNSNLRTGSDKQPFDDVNKIYVEKTIIPPPKEECKKVTQNKKSQSELFLEELSAAISGRYVGGFSYDKQKDDIRTIDVGALPDPELEFRKYQVPHLSGPSVSKLRSIEDLKYRLFSNAHIGGFMGTPMFMKKLKTLYEILSQNDHYFLEYSFNGYGLETFVFIDNTDVNNVRAYRLYFELLRGIIFGMYDQTESSVANIPRENLMYIGLSVITTLNNFGYYVFRNLISFKNYIPKYYTLVKRLNVPDTPIVSLYGAIHDVIDSFLINTRELVGGSSGGPSFDYSPAFDFFKHAYLLDILKSHQLGVAVQPQYLSSNMDDEPLLLFWDGISVMRLYKKFSLEKQFLYSIMYRTYFIAPCTSGTRLHTSYMDIKASPAKSEKARAVFLATILSEKYSYQEMLDKLVERVSKDITNELSIVMVANELENIFGPDIIRALDKLKIIDKPSKVPVFMEVIKDKKLNMESPTVFESIVFLFVLLEKLGFEVTKKFSKTNMIVNIKPALIRENIEKHIGKTADQSELNHRFVEKYGKELETLLNSSLLLARSKGGSMNPEQTEVVIALPRSDDLIVNNNITPENVESVFLGKENPISNEIKDLEKNVELMLNTNSTSLDVLYRLVPYYVKEQIKLVADLPDIGGAGDDDGENNVVDIGPEEGNDDDDERRPASRNDERRQSLGIQEDLRDFSIPPNGNETPDIISQFLSRVQTVTNRTNLESPLSQEEVEKTIDKYLKENYLQSVNRLLPFYDNKISVGNGRDRSYVLLKHTLDTINYLRQNMKVDIDMGVKTGLVSIIQLRRKSDEYCYKIFVIIQYIRHMIEELYHRLRVQPAARVISFNEFTTFFNVVSKKLKERDSRLKDLANKKINDYVNQKLGTRLELDNVNMSVEGPLFSLFNSNVARSRVA